MEPKKKLGFSKVEDQGDDFLRYSRSLPYEQRLMYMQELRRRAWGDKYENADLSRSEKKQVQFITIEENESLESFFKRFNDLKR